MRHKQRNRSYDNPAYDPSVSCAHTSDLSYTRNPCSCGRTYWPPVGRGRGESLSSPRRINAKLRGVQVLRLRMLHPGMGYAAIGRAVGLSKSGAWRAEQRTLQATYQR